MFQSSLYLHQYGVSITVSDAKQKRKEIKMGCVGGGGGGEEGNW